MKFARENGGVITGYHQGEWLKAKVQQTGRSNAAFAREVRVSREHLQRCFNEERLSMSPSMMWRVLEGLKLSEFAKMLGHVKPEESEESQSPLIQLFYAESVFRKLMHLERTGRLTPEGVRREKDAMDAATVGRTSDREWDENLDPYTEQRLPSEPPQFDLAVAAGAWTEVTDTAVLMQPGQIDAGIFRIWIRGDSMEKDWPNGALVEFRCLRQLRDALEAGRDYYVQVDGEATFKRLVKVDEENLTFAAVNKRKYPKPIVVGRSGIVRMAVAEWMLSRPGKR